MHKSANDIANQKVKKKPDGLSLMHNWVEQMSLEMKPNKRHLKSTEVRTEENKIGERYIEQETRDVEELESRGS